MPNYSFNTQGPTVAQSAIDRILNRPSKMALKSTPNQSFNTPNQSVNKPIVKPSMNVFSGLQKPWERSSMVAKVFDNPNALGKEKGVFTATPTPLNPNTATQTNTGNQNNIQNNHVASSTATTPPAQPIPPVTTPPVQSTTASTTPNAMQVGNSQQNAQNVLNASAPNAQAQGAANASALYGMLGNQAQLQPFAGGGTQNLLQSYANLSHPQSTGNLQGEMGLFNVQNGILQNAANTSAAQAQAGAQLQTQGATNVLQAGLPQLTSPGQVPFNSLTGQEGPITGTQNGGNGLLVQGNLAQLPQLQQQYTTMANNLGSINGIENLLSSSLGGNQNISDINVINQAVNKLKSHTSSPEYNQFKTLLGSLGQLYSAYLSGSGQETDTTRQLAQSLIDGTASAATIKSVLDTLKSEGMVRLNQLHSTIQNISNNPSYLPNPNSGGQTSSGSTGGVTFGWNP